MTMLASLGEMGSVVTRWRTWKLMGDQDIAMRYRRSVIGPFWISLSMAVMLFGMATLFSAIFQQDFRTYLLYLGAGLLVWNLLVAMINEGCTIAIEAEGQLRSVSIPLPVLAARITYRNLVIFLHNALVVGVEFALLGAFPGIVVIEALPGVLVILLAGFFAALVLGPICLRFRDVAQVVTNVFQFLFFLTPIMWMPDQGRVSPLFVQINPVYHMLELVRAPLAGHAPTDLNWIVSAGVVGTLMVMAWATLAIARRRIFLWL